MAEPDITQSIPLDLTTGLVTYKGIVMTYQELLQEFESEDWDHAARTHDLIDPSRDDLNVPGDKANHFRDTWWDLFKPIRKKRRMYPRDTY
jgi:hypothetical protein